MNQAMAVVSECADYGNFIGRAFCEGGTVMYLILVVGILTVFLILERAMSLSKLTLDKTSLNENLFSMMLRGDIKQAIAFCDSRPTLSPIL